MRGKNWIAGILLLGLCTALLCGCGSVKSAWTAARMGAALRDRPVTRAEGKLTAAVEGKNLGISSTAGLRMDFIMRGDPKTEKSYSELHTTVTMLGVDFPQDYQIYQQAVEEKTAWYVHLQEPDLWARTAVNWDSAMLYHLDPSVLLMLAGRASEQAQISRLEEKGDPSYRLQMNFSGEEIRDLMTAAGIKLPPEFLKADVTRIRVPVELVISADTYLPRTMEIRVEGLEGGSLQSLLNPAGKHKMAAELTSAGLTLKITGFGYEPQQLPQLPGEALAGAARMEEVFGMLKKFLGGRQKEPGAYQP